MGLNRWAWEKGQLRAKEQPGQKWGGSKEASVAKSKLFGRAGSESLSVLLGDWDAKGT